MTVNKRASLDGIDSPQPYNLIETDSGFEQQIIIIKKHRKKDRRTQRVLKIIIRVWIHCFFFDVGLSGML